MLVSTLAYHGILAVLSLKTCFFFYEEKRARFARKRAVQLAGWLILVYSI